MKIQKIIYLAFIILIINNCSRSSSDENNCKNVEGFQVTQKGENLVFTVTSQDSGPYKIGYMETGSQRYYDYIVINDKTITKSINNLDGNILSTGKTYTFSIKKICGPDSESDWGLQKNLTISNNYCNVPIKLTCDQNNQIYWSVNDRNSGQIPSYYQVQYGIQDFKLGTGTIIDTPNTYYNAPFVAGKKYDIYIRSYCNSGSGWSDWSQPLTFLASTTTACEAPSYASYYTSSIDLTSFRATVGWESDGTSTYQVTLSSSSSIPSESSLYSTSSNAVTFSNLSKSMTYYFFVRKKCSSNKYSNYYGPYTIKY